MADRTSYNLRRSAGSGARRMRIESDDEYASSDDDYVFESSVSSSTVSTTTTAYRSTATGNSSSATTSTTTATPIVQRTLYTKPDEVEDGEEEEEDVGEGDDAEDDDDDEEGDEYVEVGSRAAIRGAEEDSGDDRAIRGARRMGLRNVGAGFFQRYRVAGAGFMRRIIESQRIQKLSRQIRQFWRYTLRNSFMAANVLWLLAPLGCFLIAIVVPQYLTTAIRYVDILTTRAVGQQSGGGMYEKGTMRSIVQEIIDVRLSAVNEELLFLRNTLQSQEREVEALRVLHESLRQVHDEQQKKFSLADSDSAISIHIERVISRHTDELVRSIPLLFMMLFKVPGLCAFVEKTTTLETELHATTAMQQTILDNVKTSQEGMESIRNLASGGTASAKSEDFSSTQRELRNEFDSWKLSLQQELKAEMSREIQTLEARVSNSLSAEKQMLFDSVKSLRNVNGADPAFTSLQASLSEAGTQKAGRVDYAALVNGATVVHSESCWGLAGSSGKLSVRFPVRILVDSVTIDHIPESVASDFSSAPREFQILGLSVERGRDAVERIPFGNFSYVRGGASSQTFKLMTPINQQAGVDGVTLEINSNHGHQEYTCLYRFRVHGTPV
ncbi:Sun domain-containing protein 2, partial [Globisporangium splendens]